VSIVVDGAPCCTNIAPVLVLVELCEQEGLMEKISCLTM
jgi:hypothetical protein